MIQLMKVGPGREEREIPIYPSMVRAQRISLVHLQPIQSLLQPLQHNFRYQCCGSHRQSTETLRPLHLDQKVLQQPENCTEVAEKEPVET